MQGLCCQKKGLFRRYIYEHVYIHICLFIHICTYIYIHTFLVLVQMDRALFSFLNWAVFFRKRVGVLGLFGQQKVFFRRYIWSLCR